MKRYIIHILTVIGAIASLSAQDSYYYCDGVKIPLIENPSKVVTISSRAGTVALTQAQGFTLVNTISDEHGIIHVYDASHSATITKAREASSPQSVALVPCYDSGDMRELIPDGYINVKLKNASDYTDLQTEAKRYGCEIISQNTFMPLWYDLHIITDNGQNPVTVANQLYETGKFAEASPSFSFDAAEICYDPDVSKQWNLFNHNYDGLDISAGQAWDYATGRDIKIAIIDSGIDMSHQDLADNIHPISYDTETGKLKSVVYGNHATHCAGIAAAVRNNGKNIAGVAPDATLISVSNTLSGPNMISKLADGINWAWRNGADIISCSWWCPKNTMVGNAIDNATTEGRNGKGCVFVKSAGNNTPSHPTYDISFPGDYSKDVIAVSNMTRNGELNSKSCYGDNLFVAAPGDSIYSTIPNNRITDMSGTSMACPHVSGVAALILERNPNLTARQVREIIARNAKKVGTEPYDTFRQYGTWNEKYGYGLVDAYKSVKNTPRP